MAALLAILTFALFVAVDYFLHYRKQARVVESAETTPAVEPGFALEPALEPVWVAGYQMPDKLHYHKGHTWAAVLSPDTVAVGVDDFARRLIGRADGIQTPPVGSWVTQGATGARFTAGDREAEVVAPVEGEIVEVNPELARNPRAVLDDPYGRGWLYKIRSGQLAANLRNLLNGRLAQKWMEDAREQLEVRLMALSGSVLQDGGEIATDFSAHLKDEDWDALVDRFLLS